MGCFQSVEPARLHTAGTAKTGSPTEWFSTRRWSPWRCWKVSCLCWTTWARTLWPEFTKRSREAVRTNGPPTFLKTSSNTLWSVRTFGPVLLVFITLTSFMVQLKGNSFLDSGELCALRGASGFDAGLHRPWSSALHWLYHAHVQDHLAHAVHTSCSDEEGWCEDVAGPRKGLGWDL